MTQRELSKGMCTDNKILDCFRWELKHRHTHASTHACPGACAKMANASLHRINFKIPLKIGTWSKTESHGFCFLFKLWPWLKAMVAEMVFNGRVRTLSCRKKIAEKFQSFSEQVLSGKSTGQSSPLIYYHSWKSKNMEKNWISLNICISTYVSVCVCMCVACMCMQCEIVCTHRNTLRKWHAMSW